MKGYFRRPGLINAHDHLEFNLFPRMGRGPYPSCKVWADDIYAPDESPIREHKRVPKRVRLLWGALKNLLSGVTTVAHHNEPVLDPDFPVRVVREFGWAHSLVFSHDVADRFRATPPDWPFIIHLGEGCDADTAREIFLLDEMGALDHRTVIVHGVAIERDGIALLKRRGASVVWCPSSNLFMLGRTLAAEMLDSGVPIALGSDSALTAEGDLLDEIRIAGVDCSAMVGETARRILRLEHQPDDYAWFPDDGGLPAMVVVGGEVRLVSAELASPGEGLHRFWIDDREMWTTVDVPYLWRETVPHLGKDIRLAGKRVRC